MIKKYVSIIAALPLMIIPLAFNACTGGGKGAGPTAAANTPVISGLAAEGAALAGKMVEIRGANGNSVSTLADNQGRFSVEVPNLEYPVMLKSVGTNAYYSVAQEAGYVNVTPFTTLALTQSLGASPETIFQNFTRSNVPDKASLNAAALLVIQRFPALVGLGNVDFFQHQFNPQAGDTHDDLLEGLKDHLVANGQNLNQVLNQIVADSAPPANGCATGEHLDGASCVSNIRTCTVAHGSGEQVYVSGNWAACAVVSCHTNFNQNGGICQAASRTCLSLPAHALSGNEVWNGSAWGICTVQSCAASYELQSNACVATTVVADQNLQVRDPHFTNAKRVLTLKTIRGRTLVTTMENSAADGYLLDSTSDAKTFTRSAGGSNTWGDGDGIGADLFYQLKNESSANTITFFKVPWAGGAATAVPLTSSPLVGYPEPGRMAVMTRGNNIYYRARSELSAISPGSLFKYDVANGTSSVIIPNFSTYAVTYEGRLASENLLIYQQDSVGGNARFNFTAVDANDQVITLLQTTPGQYACNTGLSPFKDCAPVFLEGHAIYLLDSRTENSFKFVVTDGTIAGTRLVDVPYHYGGLGSLIVFQNKLVFSALKKSDLSDGYQLYTYSLADGFQLLTRINKLTSDDTSAVEIKALTATSDEIIIALTRIAYQFVGGNFVITESGQVLKSRGTAATTEILIPAVSASTLAIFKTGVYERGPMIALKGHLVYSTSTSSMTNYQMKALKLSDESVQTLKSDYTNGTISTYRKDPNFNRIIVIEPNATGSVHLGKMTLID